MPFEVGAHKRDCLRPAIGLLVLLIARDVLLETLVDVLGLADVDRALTVFLAQEIVHAHTLNVLEAQPLHQRSRHFNRLAVPIRELGGHQAVKVPICEEYLDCLTVGYMGPFLFRRQSSNVLKWLSSALQNAHLNSPAPDIAPRHP